jgi:hypothetical protein
MTTSEKLPPSHQLILFAAASPARMSATPASGLASAENDPVCGASLPESLASYDPATSSWRTSQACLTGEWAEFSGTWPDSGTMRNGQCYPLASLAPHIHGSACSYWPTPRADDRDNCGGSNARQKAYRNGTYIGRNQSPHVSEWLMGFLIGFTGLPPSATRLSRK